MAAFIRDAGSTGLLVVVVVGGFRGWYFFKWYGDELRARISDLERRLDRALATAERGATQAGRATELAEREQRGRGAQ